MSNPDNLSLTTRDPLDPKALFSSWATESVLTLFGTGKNIAAVVVDANDGMAYVLYRRDFSPLGDILEDREGVVKERLAWPTRYVAAARARNDEASVRFLYFAKWRARNANLLTSGTFAGWLQSESDRAREMIGWLERAGVDDVRDLLGLKR